jgi:hypothetical protein
MVKAEKRIILFSSVYGAKQRPAPSGSKPVLASNPDRAQASVTLQGCSQWHESLKHQLSKPSRFTNEGKSQFCHVCPIA